MADAVVEAEGIPAARQFTSVLIEEIPDGGWGVGGKAVTLEEMKTLLSASKR